MDRPIFPTGVVGTGSIGAPSIVVIDVVIPTGVEGTGAVGSVGFQVGDIYEPIGVVATGAIGTVTPAYDRIVIPTGVAGTTSVGNAVDAVVPNFSGVSATATVTQVTLNFWINNYSCGGSCNRRSRYDNTRGVDTCGRLSNT